MKKTNFVSATMLLSALMLTTACEERDWGESETEKPEWLGGSIYQELQNPDTEKLEGSFGYYLRLIDDLGMSETLKRTGSKTVFPANDDAFERFFKSNNWGIDGYEDLTMSQKRLLLNSSILDNAYLVKMLSNAGSSSTITLGNAIKHETQAGVNDSITLLTGDRMPQNNPYWDEYRNQQMYVVYDGSTPSMVHFTREQMLTNNITTTGDDSDFAIITSTPYEEGAAYIFRNRIIHRDKTCQNGYIHQVQNVIVPPGNMAEVVRQSGETQLFSRILDRFAVPVADQTLTNNYNSWALEQGKPTLPQIYRVRYLSERSLDGSDLNIKLNGEDPKGRLKFDPGWNEYYPVDKAANADLGMMLVPDDESMTRYFLPDGEGAFLMERFGKKPNTTENLVENIDSIPLDIMATLLGNLMKKSFVDYVPSKFASVPNSVGDIMGLTTNSLRKNNDGSYNVKIANNGVIYILNEVIMPDEYLAVSAPTMFNEDLSVMRWAIDDKTDFARNISSKLGLDFWAYLRAMSANYALFVPDNQAFDAYIVDPASLLEGRTPQGLHYYKSGDNVVCKPVEYNPTTHQFGNEIAGSADIMDQVTTQMADILNTHTVVLKSGEELGENHYYRTKQGAAIYVNDEVTQVLSGAQQQEDMPASKITNTYTQKNGHTYRLDHVIQTSTESVQTVLSQQTQFTEFLELCYGFTDAVSEGIFDWLGLSSVPIAPATKSEQDQMLIFAPATETFTGSSVQRPVSIGDNMTLLNSYYYTIYAPNNTAMAKAHSNGLPSWDMVRNLYNDGNGTEADKTQAKKMITTMRNFITYHVQSDYSFADKKVESAERQTLLANASNQFLKLNVSGGNGQLKVVDEAGVEHLIQEGSSMMVNRLAREYLFTYNNSANSTPTISTSSFAVIHELSEPLYFNSNKQYTIN